MDVRALLADCVLRPALSVFRASGHSERFASPALERAKPFLCDCAGVMRLFNCPVHWGSNTVGALHRDAAHTRDSDSIRFKRENSMIQT